MAQKDKYEPCCPANGHQVGCCKVEALVSVDERGQMVLPKETRDRANIRAGDKLALITWEKDGKACCLFLIKAEGLTEMVKSMLGPMMEDILQ
ncbi:MAG: AbrB family transcriptional regulator [Chloroflexi bacterium RBG_16_50_9]|nr:MAG: AbrB family transcriptional regulator [Chloroflexi bacterium RBG_16_50_9]